MNLRAKPLVSYGVIVDLRDEFHDEWTTQYGTAPKRIAQLIPDEPLDPTIVLYVTALRC